MRRLSGFSLSFQKLGFSLAKRENPASPAGAQGELPEGQERAPWGDDRDAQLVGLVATDGTCEFRCLISFILAGAVYHNTLTICATWLCRACTDSPTCVAVHYPILRKGKIKGRT